jgi:hypothetical protein
MKGIRRKLVSKKRRMCSIKYGKKCGKGKTRKYRMRGG